MLFSEWLRYTPKSLQKQWLEVTEIPGSFSDFLTLGDSPLGIGSWWLDFENLRTPKGLCFESLSSEQVVENLSRQDPEFHSPWLIRATQLWKSRGLQALIEESLPTPLSFDLVPHRGYCYLGFKVKKGVKGKISFKLHGVADGKGISNLPPMLWSIHFDLESKSQLEVVLEGDGGCSTASNLIQWAVQVGEEAKFSLNRRGKTNGYVTRHELRAEIAQLGQLGVFGAIDLPQNHREEWQVKTLHIGDASKSLIFFKAMVSRDSHWINQVYTLVERGRKNCEAYQLLRAFLLHSQAEAVLKPMLEIQCDQVQAQHGATTSAWRPDELFYMAARGIGRSRAEELLREGYLREVQEKLHFFWSAE